MANRLAALLLAPSLMLCLAAGCSSTAMPLADGSAGGTGAGGSTGAGGTAGTDAGDACAALTAAYSAAYQSARSCQPFVNSVQCTQVASPSLPCPGCQLHVQNKTELDQIRAQYEAAHCPPVPCPAIACIAPGTGSCMPVDGGALGVCIEVYPQ